MFDLLYFSFFLEEFKKLKEVIVLKWQRYRYWYRIADSIVINFFIFLHFFIFIKYFLPFLIIQKRCEG